MLNAAHPKLIARVQHNCAPRDKKRKDVCHVGQYMVLYSTKGEIEDNDNADINQLLRA